MEMEKEIREEKSLDPSLAGRPHGIVSANTDAEPSEDDDQDSSPEGEEHKHEDYSGYTKKQFVALVKELSRADDHSHADRVVREIKPLFDEIRAKERAAALQRFIDEGGVEADFEYKEDEADVAFDAHVKLIKDRKTKYLREEEDKKTDNLKAKEELLEKLRELVDSLDSNNQFESFKELQKEWKAVGPVPGAQAKTIWANYHALVDRFYDNQSIYFELKELDRKKNLEAKLDLCVRAERLGEVEIIKDAIRDLNELHHEFKHIGPVPIEDKDNVWQRFKAASDAVYARRDAYLQTLQQELNVNLDRKLAIADQVQEFTGFQSDRIKEWNQKTKEILDLQKKWEEIGGLPRSKAKEVNKKFWSAFKQFFSNKNAFFKKLDEEREQNLQLKNELVARAQELKESTDWESASNALKGLQARWKEIGPVPEKFREKVFQEFKEACDYFFEHRRNQHGKLEEEQTGNLGAKIAVCEALEKHANEGTGTIDILKDMQHRFNEIGFVPRKDLSAVRTRYNEAVERFLSSLQDVSDDEKGRILLEGQIDGLKSDPNADKKLFQKELAIRKKITKVENDIAVWRNNLEFFGRSQNAEKYKEEFHEKIQSASDHLSQLKQQLRILRTA